MIDSTAFGERIAADTLRFERLLPGPIERVWDYLTRPELLATWFEALPLPTTVGAAFEHRMACADGTLDGRICVYEPPHVLEYTWTERGTTCGDITDSVLRFDLASAGANVRLVLTHRALPASAFPSHAPGWHAFLDALAAKLAGTAPVEPFARLRDLEPRYAERLRD